MDDLLLEPFTGVPAALLTHYGLVVDRFTPLPGEYDANFHVHTSDGSEFVFKVMHSSRAPDFLDFQIKALSYVATASPHLSTPRVVPALSGASVVSLLGEDTASPPTPRLGWLLNWLPGIPFALTQPHSPPLLEALGRVIGGLTVALQGFSHPSAYRKGFKWDLAGAGWILGELDAVKSPQRKAIIKNIMSVLYANEPWEYLRMGVIHGDANDYNIVVNSSSSSPFFHLSVLDFGDAYHAPIICELATTAAYAALGHSHPLEAIASVAAGYHAIFPLTSVEWGAVFPLTLARLCVSVVNSALRVALLPPGADASYILISEAPAWQALERLHAIPPSVACARLRCAAGVPGHGIVGAASVEDVESEVNTSTPHPLVLGISGAGRLDFSPASPLITTQILQARLPTSTGGTSSTPGGESLVDLVVEEVSRRGGLGVTLPGDCVFASPARSLLFGDGGGGGGGGGVHHSSTPSLIPGQPWECVELGTTLYSTRVFEGGGVEMLFAPASGTIVEVSMGSKCVVVEHTAGASAAGGGSVEQGGGGLYYSVYTGCDVSALPYLLAQQVVVGGHISKGEPLGCMATFPHKFKGGGLLGMCHVLLLCVRPEQGFHSSSSPSSGSYYPLPLFTTTLPGLGPKFWWRTLVPFCSSTFWGLSPSSATTTTTSPAASLLARRKALMGGNVRLSYRGSEGGPLHVVRGKGSWLWSGEGVPYLDTYNNVPVVGHCHPALQAAAAGQAALLNTNTRYLHEGVLEYAEALTGLLPPSLSVCFFLNSASEANECALRLARAATGGRQDIIVLDHAYHGNTNTLIDISPYKFATAGGRGKKPWVHVAPCPDTYRGPLSHLPPHNQGPLYATTGVGAMVKGGTVPAPAAFIAESMPSVAGQLFFPPGFLGGVYEVVRGAGGVCIADEVQTGFGRMGECMWGFEHQGVVPDIVVLGKPAGGGFPLGVVVTTPKIAAAFDNGMEFFSTFGGNPVAARVGLAVLRVLQEEGLQANARDTGAWLKGELEALMPHFPIIGDVRGLGLYLGVECVSDRADGKKTPATAQTGYIVNRLKERGVLVGTEGPHNNVIKIRPPLCFNREEAGVFVKVFKEVLGEVGAGVGKKGEEKVGGVGGNTGNGKPTPLALTAGLLVAWGLGKVVVRLLADRKWGVNA